MKNAKNNKKISKLVNEDRHCDNVMKNNFFKIVMNFDIK